MVTNIKENPRNRKGIRRGRKRLLLRFERIQQRHYGIKLLAYTLMNLRAFCGT